ncbi:hypothetical protein SDRG_07940 [Saprolegnia diclina VS20]|uniref:Uncharacterized protein n=1 Tax=Saprolegnia diclina (strain VS20) TaxID=1156394 RepID=T0RQ28_SAPDV|nr:hypothetical protein SDRG_07940 [Saprolegnia diclina VS20]EQC34618.1 hypothetical protein SDRG_07940 [Saprolegnia diclina VS20]|eukprot:XP_008612024.1 hypothetical protein SDRG_07940 [Saprolegnia diclina VS20]
MTTSQRMATTRTMQAKLMDLLVAIAKPQATAEQAPVFQTTEAIEVHEMVTMSDVYTTAKAPLPPIPDAPQRCVLEEGSIEAYCISTGVTTMELDKLTELLILTTNTHNQLAAEQGHLFQAINARPSDSNALEEAVQRLEAKQIENQKNA